MAANLNPDTLTDWLARHVQDSSNNLFLAYSGGVDSHVLLHVLANSSLSKRLTALHADHGWHDDSLSWVKHCKQTCERLGVAFKSTRLIIEDARGKGLEAVSRDARYEWFASEAQHSVLLTAHHQDDQAETFLLRALRGTGTAGLGAIAADTTLGNLRVLRPFLNVTRSGIEAYAREHNLKWIEDAANKDERFDRNYLRRQIFPALEKRWPAAKTLFARTASLSRESQAVLEEIGREDLQCCRSEGFAGVLFTQRPLLVSRLSELSAARRTNALRCWWRDADLESPSQKIMTSLEQTFFSESSSQKSSENSTGVVEWGSYSARCSGGGLFLLPRFLPETFESKRWTLTTPLRLNADLTLTTNGFPETASVKVRPRREGESVRLAGRAHHHKLKKLYQQARVPPWERRLLPVLECSDQPVFAFGIGKLASWPDDWPEPDEKHLQINIDNAVC